MREATKEDKNNVYTAEKSEIRMMQETGDILTTALDQVIMEEPDGMLVCGDLTSNGEYDNAGKFIEKLKEAKSSFKNDAGIYVVNGNHDINNSYAANFEDGEIKNANRMDSFDFKRLFGELSYGKELRYYDVEPEEEIDNYGALSYATEIADGVTLITLDTGTYGNNKNARYGDAQKTAGAVSDGLLEWAEKEAKAAKARGDLVMTMSHHPILPHYEPKTDAGKAFASDYHIKNWKHVADTLADAGVSAFLTGHTHANDISKHKSAKGNTVYDIGTAALCAYPVAWRTLEITKTGNGTDASYEFNVRTKFIEDVGGIDSTLDDTNYHDFQTFAYHKTGLRKQAVDPFLRYFLRSELYELKDQKDPVCGDGFTGLLRKLTGLKKDESVGEKAKTTIKKHLDKFFADREAIETESLLEGVKLTMKPSSSEGDKYLIDVKAETGSGDSKKEEKGTLTLDLSNVGNGIDNALGELDNVIKETDTPDNYFQSDLENDICDIVMDPVTDLLTKELRKGDDKSTALHIMNDGMQACARGEEQFIVTDIVRSQLGGNITSEELAEKRAEDRSLLRGKEFKNHTKAAICEALKNMGPADGFKALNGVLSVSLKPEGEDAHVANISNAATEPPGGETEILGPDGSFNKTLHSLDTLGGAGVFMSVVISSSDMIPGSVLELPGEFMADLHEAFTTDPSIEEDSHWDFQSVIFDPQGGSVYPASSLTVERNRLGTIPTPVREGYIFKGWFTQVEGGTLVNEHSDMQGIRKVYARWEKEAEQRTDSTEKNSSNGKEKTFTPIKLKASKTSKKTVTLSWKRIKKAEKYVVYGARCGSDKKNPKFKKIKTVKANAKETIKLKVRKVNGRKLKKGKYYVFSVTALDKNGKELLRSEMVYAATKGGKAGNHSKVIMRVKKGSSLKKIKKAELKEGKSLKLKCRAVKRSKKRKVTVYRQLAYESTNEKVATVSAKGMIKAKAKGKCYIYAYAQNGVCARVKVTVK